MMRERLIELMRDTFNYTKGVCIDFDEAVEINADYLLENGVVVLPCKVGQRLWYASKYCKNPYAIVVSKIVFFEDKIIIRTENGVEWYAEDVGKAIFVSYEDAERALKGDEGK